MAGPACAIALGALVLGLGNPAPDDDPPLSAKAPSNEPTARERSAGAAMAKRRRVELDMLERQDAALALARLGVTVDWRALPLAQLSDMRLRALKATELRTDFAVAVDWRRYSWAELEAMRELLARFNHDRPPNVADRSVPSPVALPPSLPASPPASPPASQVPLSLLLSPAQLHDDDVIRPTFAWHARPERSTSDPDGVISPSFTSRPVLHRRVADPEDVLAPTFAPLPHRGPPRPIDADDLIEP